MPASSAHLLTTPFDTPSSGDVDDPWSEAGGLVDLAQSLIGAQEYILGQILGVRQVARVVVADRPDYGRKPVVKCFIGSSITCDDGSYELLFAPFGQRETLRL